MNNINKVLALGVSAGFIFGFLFFINFFNQTPSAIGSVAISNEYRSTTTPTASAGSEGFAGVFTLATTTGAGTLGSVIITGTSSGAFAIYDATTTNALLRTPMSTSSITLASFPAGMPAGTYTFDTAYNRGLIAVFTALVGTTTITYR